MPLPKEVLVAVNADIEKATASLAELKDVITDMKLSGMETTKQDADYDRLSDSLRSLSLFYDRQKAKSTG